MKNSLLSLLVLISVVACGKGGGGGSSSNGDSVSLEEVSTSSVVPSAALNFDINLRMDNFNATQEDKVLTAADLIKKVVASEEFKNRILNHTYNGKKGFAYTDMTNAEVYKAILEGSEKLSPGSNNTMDLDLEVYTAQNNVVGYTKPSVIRIWMNSKFLNQNNAAEVTTNMMHEWLHKVGFKHPAEKTAIRKYSVPYAVGYLVRNLARKMS